MIKTESLKQQLNALYGRPLYELKVPVCNEIKNFMEVENMIKASPNEYIDTDIMPAATIQQKIYRALCDDSKKADEEKKERPWDTPEEKWVWVTGYKGLDKDMKAYGGFQYEMDKLYIMPDGEPVEACHGGFHLCLNLKDLYSYKPIGVGNRFFECKALVREKDLEKYGKTDPDKLFYYISPIGASTKIDKLAGKSIHLTRELSVDEILAHETDIEKWPDYVKQMAVDKDVDTAKKEILVLGLIGMGYARPLAEYICNDRNSEEGVKLAMALDAQKDISMDTKIIAIFSHI